MCCLFSSSILFANETIELDDIVVSATGYEQKVKYAPASISVISKEEIINRPIRDIGDMVQEIPGVTTTINKVGGTDIQIRGMSSDYTLILVDGKRMNTGKGFDSKGFNSKSGFFPPTSMIERVEVIRGPASVIYGSDAMGGVINIITKKNLDEPSGSLSFETTIQEDSDRWGNTYGVNGNVFSPINEYLSFNLRFKYDKGEKNEFFIQDIEGYDWRSYRYKDNPYTTHSPLGYKSYLVGGRLNFTPNENNKFYLDADYTFQRLGSLNSGGGKTVVRDFEKYNIILDHEGKYSWGDINSYIHYANNQRYSHKDVPIGASSGTKNKDSLVKYETIVLSSIYKKAFDFSNDSALIVNAGPYFFKEKMHKRAGEDNEKDDFNKDAYQFAVFGEGEYIFNEYVSTTAGLRVNYVEDFGTFYNPRLYLSLFPTEWLTLKAGVSSGMQVPELGARYDGYYDTTTGRGGVIRDMYGNTSLDVERTWNYELSAMVDAPLATFTLTGYYTEFEDAIRRVTYSAGETLPGGYGVCGAYGGTECQIFDNVDKAVAKGLEFSMNSKALLTDIIPRGIYLDFSYALTKTEQKSGDYKGLPLNLVPKHNLSTKISYKTPNWDAYIRWVGKLDTPTSTSNPEGANEAVGKYYKDVHIVDVGANYRFKNGVTVGAMINNLFDEDFVEYVAYDRGKSYTNRYQKMIPGRNFWLNVRYDF